MAAQCCVLDPPGRWRQRLHRQQLTVHVGDAEEMVEAGATAFGMAHCFLESRGSVWIYAQWRAGNGV